MDESGADLGFSAFKRIMRTTTGEELQSDKYFMNKFDDIYVLNLNF